MKDNLSICVCGWYGYSSCYGPLSKSNYTINVIAHKECNTLGIPTTIIPNIGLEFGAFEYYRQNTWDKNSNVLFLQDDIDIKDISFIDDIEIKSEVIMIWHDEKQQKRNLCHGRAFIVVPDYLKTHEIWYDKNNHGNIDANKGANAAVREFYIKTRKITTHHYTNKIKFGRRGIV